MCVSISTPEHVRVMYAVTDVNEYYTKMLKSHLKEKFSEKYQCQSAHTASEKLSNDELINTYKISRSIFRSS